jgi:hypothetical protein
MGIQVVSRSEMMARSGGRRTRDNELASLD